MIFWTDLIRHLGGPTKPRRHSSQGQVSLAAILISGAIGATSLMAIAGLQRTLFKGQSTLQSRTDGSNLQTTLSIILGNPTLCKKAFWDSETNNNVPAPRIAYFDPENPKLPVNKLPFAIHFGSAVVANVGGLIDPFTTLRAIALKEADKSARQSDTFTTTYVASLSLDFSTNGRGIFGGARPINQFLYIQTDNVTHEIVACANRLPLSAVPTPSPTPSLGSNIAGCTVRYATKATAGTCGGYATADCAAGEYSLTGGIIAMNVMSQSSFPLLDSAGKPVGWRGGAVEDVPGTVCFTQPGQQPFTDPQYPNEFCFYDSNHANFWCLGVMAVCCR